MHTCMRDYYLFTGVELTFFSGVYGTSVGQSAHYGSEAKSLIGLVGIFIGVGEILGKCVPSTMFYMCLGSFYGFL